MKIFVNVLLWYFFLICLENWDINSDLVFYLFNVISDENEINLELVIEDVMYEVLCCEE